MEVLNFKFWNFNYKNFNVKAENYFSKYSVHTIFHGTSNNMNQMVSVKKISAFMQTNDWQNLYLQNAL